MNQMKRFYLLSLSIFVGFSAYAQQWQCGTSGKMQAALNADPSLLITRQKVEEFTQRWVAEHSGESERAVVTIPVVVHVVYNTSSQNISTAQVQSQIDVLNEDYRAMNADVSGVPSVWTNRVADSEIQFALAAQDPDGFLTNGITRTETTVSDPKHVCVVCMYVYMPVYVWSMNVCMRRRKRERKKQRKRHTYRETETETEK